MRIIISPAKKMNQDLDSIPWNDLPCFIEQAEILYRKMRSMTGEELKRLWKCNDSIVQLNQKRLGCLQLRKNLTPAILAYEGIQYRYMAPRVFTREAYNYVQEHLRILSGLYGMLRPLDGVVPYRLEMQAQLQTEKGKTLYQYWGRAIAEYLFQETDCIVNLASKEYSLCISPYLWPEIRFITCVFGEEYNGKIREKGTLCKMARGEMVRYLAECGADGPEAIKDFSRLNYVFSPKHSNEHTYVFLKQTNDSGDKDEFFPV